MKKITLIKSAIITVISLLLMFCTSYKEKAIYKSEYLMVSVDDYLYYLNNISDTIKRNKLLKKWEELGFIDTTYIGYCKVHDLIKENKFDTISYIKKYLTTLKYLHFSEKNNVLKTFFSKNIESQDKGLNAKDYSEKAYYEYIHALVKSCNVYIDTQAIYSFFNDYKKYQSNRDYFKDIINKEENKIFVGYYTFDNKLRAICLNNILISIDEPVLNIALKDVSQLVALTNQKICERIMYLQSQKLGILENKTYKQYLKTVQLKSLYERALVYQTNEELLTLHGVIAGL